MFVVTQPPIVPCEDTHWPQEGPFDMRDLEAEVHDIDRADLDALAPKVAGLSVQGDVFRVRGSSGALSFVVSPGSLGVFPAAALEEDDDQAHLKTEQGDWQIVLHDRPS